MAKNMKLSVAMKGNTNASGPHRDNGQSGVSSSGIMGGRGVVHPPFVKPTPKSFPGAAKVGANIGGALESISFQATGAKEGAKAGYKVGAAVGAVKNVFTGQSNPFTGNTTMKGNLNRASERVSGAFEGAKVGRSAGSLAASISTAGETRGATVAENFIRKIDSKAETAKWAAIDAKDRVVEAGRQNAPLAKEVARGVGLKISYEASHAIHSANETLANSYKSLMTKAHEQKQKLFGK